MCHHIMVYILPSAEATASCDVICSVTARLQTQHPNEFVGITSVFNHTLSGDLPTFPQLVSCSTRDNKTLNILYANIKDAYHSTTLPPLGNSGHNLVLLTCKYCPIVEQQPAVTKTLRDWSLDAHKSVQGCFVATDWDVLVTPTGL